MKIEPCPMKLYVTMVDTIPWEEMHIIPRRRVIEVELTLDQVAKLTPRHIGRGSGVMVVTEEEAGKMICPVVDHMRLQGHECRASGCMAWRWAMDYETGERKPVGYCGLAGIPEEA